MCCLSHKQSAMKFGYSEHCVCTGAMLSFICGPDFVGLSDVIKNGHTRAKNDGQDIENWQLLEKLDSQKVPKHLLSSHPHRCEQSE